MKISDLPRDKCPFCLKALVYHDSNSAYISCSKRNAHYAIHYGLTNIIKIAIFLPQLEVWIFSLMGGQEMMRVFNRQDEVVLDLPLRDLTITDFFQLEHQLQTLINFQ